MSKNEYLINKLAFTYILQDIIQLEYKSIQKQFPHLHRAVYEV